MQKGCLNFLSLSLQSTLTCKSQLLFSEITTTVKLYYKRQIVKDNFTGKKQITVLSLRVIMSYVNMLLSYVYIRTIFLPITGQLTNLL